MHKPKQIPVNSSSYQKTKRKMQVNINETSYEPSHQTRVRRNVRVSRELIKDIKSKINHDFDYVECGMDHKKKKCKCDGLYLYLDIHIAMQFPRSNTNGTKIFNTRLSNAATGDDIYVVIDETKDNDGIKWRMRDKLFDKQMIRSMFKIKAPPSIRFSQSFRENLSHSKMI